MKPRDFIENCVLFVIFLVLIQTFLDDLSVVMSWSWPARRMLIVSGFVFDLFFSLEFLIRYFAALGKGRGIHYIYREQGWIDFLAAFPLLFFSSGPALLSVLQGGVFMGAGGFLNVLKVVKTVRIARVLRLLRLLKVFKKIKFVNSRMAQRHMTRIVTTAISSFVLTMTLVSFLSSFFPVLNGEEEYMKKQEDSARIAQFFWDGGEPGRISGEFKDDESVLIIQGPRGSLYSRYDNAHYRYWFGPGDYGTVKAGDIILFYSLKSLYARESVNNLIIFFSIIGMLLLLMLSYSPHFAMTITDPVNIMYQGLSDPSYNLEVLVPGEFQSDDIFRLAREYNREYLPLKARNTRDSGGLVLKVDNIEDLFK